jgi:hypothetical protein
MKVNFKDKNNEKRIKRPEDGKNEVRNVTKNHASKKEKKKITQNKEGICITQLDIF